MEKVILQYLTFLQIPVSEKYSEQLILSHPEYPSLLSISDVLERLGIAYQAVRSEKENLDKLSFPCILHIDRQEGQLLFLKEQADLDKYKSELEHWSGVVLKIEPTDTITDEEHNKQFEQERIQRRLATVLICALLALIYISAIQITTWWYLSLLTTSVGGIAVGYLLFAELLGVSYKPVKDFCNAGKKTSCERILNAKDTQLFGFLTLTDAATSYFAFQFIVLGIFVPFFESSKSFLLVMAGASMLAIPVIVYSLYYQAIKADTWCKLCIIVDVILGWQVTIFVVMYFEQIFMLTDIALASIAVSSLLFVAIILSLLLLRLKLAKNDEASRTEALAKRVKHDPEVFTQLLLKGEAFDATPFSPEMIIGAYEAPVKIMMVANLNCDSCRIAFDHIKQILATYPAEIHFAIRFTKGMDNTIGELSASTYLIRYWKHHIYDQSNEGKRTQKLITDWYSEMDPEAFLSQYPIQGKPLITNTKKLENQHYEWVEREGISRTPTYFINGHKMPTNYRIKDLMVMMPGLVALWKERAINIQKNTIQKNLL